MPERPIRPSVLRKEFENRIAPRTHNRMEWHIVFTEEVIQFDMLRVLPPLFPIASIKIVPVCVILGNARVTNAGIEPDVKDLRGILFQVQSFDIRDGNAPLEVACDGS